MSSYLYAAYGSNLHPVRLQKRVSSATFVGTCLLAKYELRFHKVSDVDGSGKCNVVPGKKGVYLAIFRIEESERSILDREEGLNYGYNATQFETEAFGRCSSYLADASAIDESAQPMDWYKEMVRLGCLVNGFSNTYVQRVESVAAIVDSDKERASQRWKIVEDMRQATLR